MQIQKFDRDNADHAKLWEHICELLRQSGLIVRSDSVPAFVVKDSSSSCSYSVVTEEGAEYQVFCHKTGYGEWSALNGGQVRVSKPQEELK